MAFDAYDDYEQSERVQKWLRQNGVSIVVGIVIGLVAIFGWQQWRKHQANHQAAAAQIYQQVRDALASGHGDQADALIAGLMKDYADTAYAMFAVSDRAAKDVRANQLDKALVSLDWAQQHANSPALKSLAGLRIARVQLAQGHADQALATLDKIPAADYPGLVQELRGDALVKLKRPDDARKAYQAAEAALDKSGLQGGDLQMKIDDLAVAGKQGA
ncbi:tetratricopeptide repeat protein [Fulvimonas sp. R45]|uniref:YfgM family protein n=1 Tax=Fulvimonas sp. R45 TaxID=3045937 RepID=UPI00265DC8B5|nr:tetratricopeptide repeat protein [Fulvimonas sp. R45]MDO1527274.1 tetratricopeptide repeat protein [Fulvimonas sp. R45]